MKKEIICPTWLENHFAERDRTKQTQAEQPPTPPELTAKEKAQTYMDMFNPLTAHKSLDVAAYKS